MIINCSITTKILQNGFPNIEFLYSNLDYYLKDEERNIFSSSPNAKKCHSRLD